jgi:uncharacterized protein
MRLLPLRSEHTHWLRERAAEDPAQHVFLLSLLELTRTAEVSSAAGTLYGLFRGHDPVAAYWVGGSIISLGATPETNARVARMLNVRGRYHCSLIGEHRAVLDLHHRLEWGTPRSIRPNQPLMVADRAPEVEPDPTVRVGTIDDVDAAYAAAVEMFTEEVGFSPVTDGSAGYYGKVRSNLTSGSTLLSTTETGPDGRPMRDWPARGSSRQVVFKADLGIRCHEAVQVQGVWVHPDFRGRGLGAPGMVTVSDYVREHVAPIVSLYVNSFNEPALRTYERAGFSQVGRFATVMY